MELTYYFAASTDANRPALMKRTKQEVRDAKAAQPKRYGALEKVVLSYTDAFDLLEQFTKLSAARAAAAKCQAKAPASVTVESKEADAVFVCDVLDSAIVESRVFEIVTATPAPADVIVMKDEPIPAELVVSPFEVAPMTAQLVQTTRPVRRLFGRALGYAMPLQPAGRAASVAAQ